MHFLSLNPTELHKTFRLNKDVLERHLPTGKWRKVNIAPNAQGYTSIAYGEINCRLHRILWVLRNNKDVPKGMEIDHIDGDRSNNKANNLRIVTRRENQTNRLIHRQGRLPGGRYNKKDRKWKTSIRVGKKDIYLGSFDTESEAVIAYQNASKKIVAFAEEPYGRVPVEDKA